MRVEFDGQDRTITINGVAIAFEILEQMTNPNPRASLRFFRRGDSVDVVRTITDEPIGFYVEPS